MRIKARKVQVVFNWSGISERCFHFLIRYLIWGLRDSNSDEGHLGDFWDFDFLDEDECTVPYDCGYDEEEEEEDYSEDETEEDTEVYDP